MYNEYLEFAKDIALKAGKIMLKYFNEKVESSYKVDKTIVTKADKEINHYLIEEVRKQFPNHSVYGEEEMVGNGDYVWVCDPIDGTAMYARELPVSVFSLALCIKGMPVVGVVYDPFTDHLYYASHGDGAFCNDNKICVSNIKLEDKESVAHFDMWPSAEYNIYDVVKKLGKKTYFVSIGSIIRASMCVASGKFTLALFPGTVNKFYDIAAVKIIVEEAGGIVTNLFGNNQRYDTTIKGAIISNKTVYDEVIDLIRKSKI